MKRRICGLRPVQEALAANPRGVALLLLSEDSARGALAALADEARRAGVTVETRGVAELDALAGGVRHQGAIAIAGGDYPYVELEAALERVRDPGLLVALDEVTDVHNFGAIIRSCVALGADAVVTLRDRAAPVNATVVRSSAGASEHATIARVTNLARTLDALTAQGFATVGLDAAGPRTLAETDFRRPVVLVVGSEGRGLRRLVRERCSELARIPMTNAIGSLNASVAAALALYEVVRQRSPS